MGNLLEICYGPGDEEEDEEYAPFDPRSPAFGRGVERTPLHSEAERGKGAGQWPKARVRGSGAAGRSSYGAAAEAPAEFRRHTTGPGPP